MSLTKGGWDIITVSQPPFTLKPGTRLSVVVEFYSDDAEPVERKDTAIVEVSSVRKYRHLTTFVGRVVGGDIDPLLREVVTGSLADDRKGALELAPATDAPARPDAVPDEAVRGWLWADESGASWLPDTPIPEPAETAP